MTPCIKSLCMVITFSVRNRSDLALYIYIQQNIHFMSISELNNINFHKMGKKMELFRIKTHLVFLIIRYAGVCVYSDITRCKDFGMDCCAFSIRLIGMLDDVNLQRKLNKRNDTACQHPRHFIKIYSSVEKTFFLKQQHHITARVFVSEPYRKF